MSVTRGLAFTACSIRRSNRVGAVGSAGGASGATRTCPGPDHLGEQERVRGYVLHADLFAIGAGVDGDRLTGDGQSGRRQLDLDRRSPLHQGWPGQVREAQWLPGRHGAAKLHPDDLIDRSGDLALQLRRGTRAIRTSSGRSTVSGSSRVTATGASTICLDATADRAVDGVHSLRGDRQRRGEASGAGVVVELGHGRDGCRVRRDDGWGEPGQVDVGIGIAGGIRRP